MSDYADPNLTTSLALLLALNKVQPNSNKDKLHVYNKIARNGRFGSFRYRDMPRSRDARIEVEPEWITQNIIKLELPSKLQSLPKFNHVKFLRVNKHVISNWRQVFTTISADISLLNLIDVLDPGTFYPRHIRKNVLKGISNHSWGTAIDINPIDHPLNSHVDEEEDLDDANLILYQKVFKPAGFNWGNSYNDPMHFEILTF